MEWEQLPLLSPNPDRLRCAVAFTASMPVWDRGRSLSPITDLLRCDGFKVIVVDTLSVVDETVRDVRETADRWAVELGRLGCADLLVGNALGGAVVQALLGRMNPPLGAILVSAPTRANEKLLRRLSVVVGLAEQNLLHEAVLELSRLVAPIGTRPSPPVLPAPSPTAAFRMSRKRLLYGLDLTDEVCAFSGPLLHIVGRRSRLVGRRHVVSGCPAHRVIAVPRAGMRPHWDQSARVTDHVRRFVHEVVATDEVRTSRERRANR